MCMQCMGGAMVSLTAATGIRAWLGTRSFAWLTPARLRWLTASLLVLALLGSSLSLSGSGA